MFPRERGELGEGFIGAPTLSEENRPFKTEFRQIGSMLQCDFDCRLCLNPALRICIGATQMAPCLARQRLVQHHFRGRCGGFQLARTHK
jgi:hypothetical protein